MTPTAVRRRPWLAALLSIVLPGLGHLYLRDWFRAVAWFGLFVGVSYLYVPDATFLAPLDASLMEVLPALLVMVFATIDAVLRAKRHNIAVGDSQTEGCPRCGRPLDPELTFCHWCTYELDSSATGGHDGH